MLATDKLLEFLVLSGMWSCLDALQRPGANHSLLNLSEKEQNDTERL